MISSLLVPLLFLLFQASVNSGKVPEGWRQANVTPIHMAGSKTLPKNFRPISLTSTVGKLLETILMDHVCNYIDENNIIPPSQHEFMSQRSFTSILIQFFDPISKILDTGMLVDIVCFNFKEAFDLVPHHITSLEWMWIPGESIELCGRTQRVVLNGVESDTITPGSVIMTYADDTKFGRVIEASKDSTVLQNDIDRLTQWTEDTLMEFKIDKCKVVYAGHNNVHNSYFVGREPIGQVDAHQDPLV